MNKVHPANLTKVPMLINSKIIWISIIWNVINKRSGTKLQCNYSWVFQSGEDNGVEFSLGSEIGGDIWQC